jgi:topoisomerase IA-like protein
MAKYSKGAGKKVETAMREMKEGKLKSGRSGKKVTNPKQAIAIGLSEAREKGAKVPAKKGAAKKSCGKTASKKGAAKKTSAKKGTSKTSRKGATKKAASKSRK